MTTTDLRERSMGRLSQRLRVCRGVVLTIATCAYAATAAADYSCRVSVSGVLQYYEGSINVLHSGRGDWTMVCNMNAPRTNGLTVLPTTCANWFVVLLRAKKNNQLVDFWFPGTGSCATIGTYGDAPVPIYIGESN